MRDAAVVTGIGVAAPTGTGIREFWTQTVAGRSALSVVPGLDRTDATLAGRVDFAAVSAAVPTRLMVQTDRWTQLALATAQWALDDARLDPGSLDDYDLGVVIASCSGGNEFGQREMQKLWGQGPKHVSAYQSIAWFYAASTGQLSIRHGARGPCGVLVSEQASGLDALGQARREIRAGTRAVLCGGTEAPMSPYAMLCQAASGRLSRVGDVSRAYLPFDEAGSGHVPGEGGAMLVVESAAGAAARGVSGYGVIAGYAATFDPAPGSGRPPGLARAIRAALADADVTADDIDVVFADAAGVPGLDRAEAVALCEVFGPCGVPVTAPKAGTGRLCAGAGSLDTATALLALRAGAIPPTPAVSRIPPEYRIDLVVSKARPARLHTALVLARGEGGFNSAVVIRATGEQHQAGKSSEAGEDKDANHE
jgi:act minimal PKS chain-length factor (CLF/KS beta)